MCRNQICRSEHRSASHNKDDAELKKAQVFAIPCRRHAKWHSAAIIVNRPWAESSLLSCLSLSASSCLFRWFHDFSFMRVAIADWTAADQEIDNLTELADQLHAETFSDHPNSLTVRHVLEEIEACDSRLTLTENHFSSTLAEGDRWTRNLLNLLTVGTSALLLVLGIGTSRHLLSNVRRSEEKYRRLFDSASDAILIIDYETGIVLEANARGADLFGIPSERLAFVPA